MFKFFDEFIFLDHLEVAIDEKINVLSKYILNRFHNTIPPSRLSTTLSLLDNVILKLQDKN